MTGSAPDTIIAQITQKGVTKDLEIRTHPALPPWEDLPEADKESNRIAVGEMPAFFGPGRAAGLPARVVAVNSR